MKNQLNNPDDQTDFAFMDAVNTACDAMHPKGLFTEEPSKATGNSPDHTTSRSTVPSKGRRRSETQAKTPASDGSRRHKRRKTSTTLERLTGALGGENSASKADDPGERRRARERLAQRRSRAKRRGKQVPLSTVIPPDLHDEIRKLELAGNLKKDVVVKLLKTGLAATRTSTAGGVSV